MFSKLATIASLSTAALADSPVTIMENGKTLNLFAAGGPYSKTHQYQNGIDTPHNDRVYLTTKDFNQGWQGDGFYAPNLFGGSIEYDVDLSQSHCSCNAALYLVSMPGVDMDGNPTPGDGGDYYCDANKGGGQWCPEMDIMEANQYAWHMTPHTCDAPNDKGHYWNCDRGGCGKNIWSIDPNGYGPGDQHKINTLKPFHVKTEFKENSGRMTDIVQTFTQEGRTFVLQTNENDCASGYLATQQGDLQRGMVITISNWGEAYQTMSWLDQDTGCQGDCDNSPEIMITNIQVTTVHKPGPPTPPPTPPAGDYDFGNDCATKDADECGSSCNECAWSWPRNDPAKWNSKDAHCRCKVPYMAETETEKPTIIQ